MGSWTNPIEEGTEDGPSSAASSAGFQTRGATSHSTRFFSSRYDDGGNAEAAGAAASHARHLPGGDGASGPSASLRFSSCNYGDGDVEASAVSALRQRLTRWWTGGECRHPES